MSSAKVIVVGMGLAGLSAAHTLYERGANVLVMERNAFGGGNSTKATSGINGSATNPQADLSIQDSNRIFYEDTKRSARDRARPDLIEALTGKSGDAIHWLQKQFKLDLSKVSRLGGHSQPRTHRGGAQFPGMTITYAQMEKLEDLAEHDPKRVQILRKARVTKLIYENEEVKGVEYETDGKSFKEYGPVIIATGGYAADFDSADSLLKKHRPDLLHLPTTNGDHCTGDGQKMMMNIGARGIDLDKVQVHPTGLVDPKDPDAKVKFLAAEALRGVGGLLLDNEGQRFCDELGHRDYVTGEMWKNNKFPIRLILNGQSSKEIEWHCKHYTGRGLMKRFNSGHELAKEMGISSEALQKTFDDYNAITEKKKKDPYGKKFFHGGKFHLDDIFHAAHMTPVLHFTMGGIEILPSCEVVDTKNETVKGLYACGEVAGGVHGANRLGGSSLLGCVVFGRIAGETAASQLMKDMSAGKVAAQRLGQIQQHLETKVRVDPESKKVNIEFSWEGDQLQQGGGSNYQQTKPADSAPARQVDTTTAEKHESQTVSGSKADPASKQYTLDDVAKHNKEDDCWVVVNGQVLDVTKFLPDHPGGAKAILLYAGRDATEEFNMLHDPKVVGKYAPDSIIGTFKA